MNSKTSLILVISLFISQFLVYCGEDPNQGNSFNNVNGGSQAIDNTDPLAELAIYKQTTSGAFFPDQTDNDSILDYDSDYEYGQNNEDIGDNNSDQSGDESAPNGGKRLII